MFAGLFSQTLSPSPSSSNRIKDYYDSFEHILDVKDLHVNYNDLTADEYDTLQNATKQFVNLERFKITCNSIARYPDLKTCTKLHTVDCNNTILSSFNLFKVLPDCVTTIICGGLGMYQSNIPEFLSLLPASLKTIRVKSNIVYFNSVHQTTSPLLIKTLYEKGVMVVFDTARFDYIVLYEQMDTIAAQQKEIDGLKDTIKSMDARMQKMQAKIDDINKHIW